jgi:hypothetical protein
MPPKDVLARWRVQARSLARPVRKRLAGPARNATWFVRPTPDALLLGAMKAGTTSFATALDHHPDIQMARRKEVSYFDMDFDRGQRWYRSQFSIRRPWRSLPLAFEATPYYLFFP